MPDREKVIKGMEYCIDYAQRVNDLINDVPCEGCPYVALKPIAVGQGDCIDSLFKDALALLKAQEPIKPVVDIDTWKCGNCGHALEHQQLLGDNVLFHEQYNYCPECGRAVKLE